MKAKVYGLINEKGGVGKSTTAATAAYVLAKQGKKVLLIDFDGQGHASLLCGVPNINKLPTTTATLMNAIIDGKALPEPESYLHHHAGVDLVPSNSQLFALERNLSNADFRETKLSELVDTLRDCYDYILIDCMPNGGTPQINVMMAADEIIIPTQAEGRPGRDAAPATVGRAAPGQPGLFSVSQSVKLAYSYALKANFQKRPFKLDCSAYF